MEVRFQSVPCALRCPWHHWWHSQFPIALVQGFYCMYCCVYADWRPRFIVLCYTHTVSLSPRCNIYTTDWISTFAGSLLWIPLQIIFVEKLSFADACLQSSILGWSIQSPKRREGEIRIPLWDVYTLNWGHRVLPRMVEGDEGTSDPSGFKLLLLT